MRKLMEDQLRELSIGIAHDGIEYRIVEPAQRRIGRNAGYEYVQALALQFLAELLGTNLAEIAAIADATRKRKTPLLRRNRKLVGRKYIPDNERTLHVGVFSVTAVV